MLGTNTLGEIGLGEIKSDAAAAITGTLAATEGADGAEFAGTATQPQPEPGPQRSGGINVPERLDPRMFEMLAVVDVRLKLLSCEADAAIQWNPVSLDDDLLMLAAA